MPAPNGGQAYYIDGDAWTCPHCGETYRRRTPARYPAAQRGPRMVRDEHKCPEVLPR